MQRRWSESKSPGGFPPASRPGPSVERWLRPSDARRGRLSLRTASPRVPRAPPRLRLPPAPCPARSPRPPPPARPPAELGPAALESAPALEARPRCGVTAAGPRATTPPPDRDGAGAGGSGAAAGVVRTARPGSPAQPDNCCCLEAAAPAAPEPAPAARPPPGPGTCSGGEAGPAAGRPGEGPPPPAVRASVGPGAALLPPAGGGVA